MRALRPGLGAAGEQVVARWYRRAGYRVVARNWRCREGEIDLVVRRRDEVVFCEVKTRSRDAGFGLPAEAVGAAKQARLRKAARAWLAAQAGRRGNGFRSLRFDVASVMWPPDGAPVVEVIEGAF